MNIYPLSLLPHSLPLSLVRALLLHEQGIQVRREARRGRDDERRHDVGEYGVGERLLPILSHVGGGDHLSVRAQLPRRRTSLLEHKPGRQLVAEVALQAWQQWSAVFDGEKRSGPLVLELLPWSLYLPSPTHHHNMITTKTSLQHISLIYNDP